MQILVGVGLFPIVKMRGDGVLEKVHQQIAAQKQQGSVAPGERQALGDHFDQRRCQHETRAQRHKIAQIAAVPVLLHDDRAAENVRRGSRQAEQNAEDDWVHG